MTEYRSVDISRQIDALYAAWRTGVVTDDEWATRSAPLRDALHAAAAAEYEAVDPRAVIDVPVVVAGELVESAWGNAVRADLLELNSTKIDTTVADARYVDVTGDTMTGNLTVNARLYADKFDTAHSIIGPTYHRVTVASVLAGTNILFERHGDTDANGGTFARFYRGGANTLIGSISQLNSTTTAYNTTSDKRLKDLTRPVDGAEAVAKLAALEPVHFTWTDYPDQGEDIGFFAQDAYPVAPEMIYVGQGEPGDDEFTPWGIDAAKLVPTLVAALNALAARVAALESGTG